MGKDRIGRFVPNVSKLSLIMSSLTKHAGRPSHNTACYPPSMLHIAYCRLSLCMLSYGRSNRIGRIHIMNPRGERTVIMKKTESSLTAIASFPKLAHGSETINPR